ncbi:MAG: hypothetical protein GY737_09360 [Desulfobacteraceae bacterium]|nr:hypothetical protein [Desulfobacteraceae bacterium]
MSSAICTRFKWPKADAGRRTGADGFFNAHHAAPGSAGFQVIRFLSEVLDNGR